MLITEDERTELHNADEAGEVENFSVGVSAVEDAGEVEKFGPLVDFCPEALLEGFLGVLECGSFLDEV